MKEEILAKLPPSGVIRACMAKLHRLTVTEADLSYVGSITLDEDFMDAVGIQAGQYVNITGLEEGAYWQTYVLPGARGSRRVCLNGPPAHHFKPGHLIIVLAEIWLKPDELKDLELRVLLVDDKNKDKDERNEITKVMRYKGGREI